MMVTDESLRPEQERKLRAKKFNEHVKLAATTVNGIALFLIIAGFLQPLVQQGTLPAIGGGLGWI